MAIVGPIPPTGPRGTPPISLAQLREWFRKMESRVLNLEKNRTPAPTPLHGLANAAKLQQAQPGHAPVFQPINGQNSGVFERSPVLATLLFTMPGALSIETSDPVHARYLCNIVGFSADLSTFVGSFDVIVTVAGAHPATETVPITSGSTGFIQATTLFPLDPYADTVTVETSGSVSGNVGLVFHVELAVDPLVVGT